MRKGLMRPAGRSSLRALLMASLVAASPVAWSGLAEATPSSTLWTNATTDVQGFRSVHMGVDNYFTAFRQASDGAGAFPTDVGLTAGVSPSPRFPVEIGADWVEPT